jgi:hypothetical protein
MNRKLLVQFVGPFFGVVAALALLNGCGESPRADAHGHSHEGEAAHDHDAGHAGDHGPPHGGTPVNIADDKFHLELVLDSSAGKMQAYVLDGHLEGYVPVSETTFAIVASVGAKAESLAFQRAPDAASGKVPEKSSLFEAQAEWVKTAKEFEGRIPTITLAGKTFTNISFSFPKGSKHVH